MSVWVPVGTRPEAIKMAPVVSALRRRGVPVVVCETGQHEVLARSALESCGVTPDRVLPPVPRGSDLPATLGFLVGSLGAALRERPPRAVLVHGDTTSTLAAALAATSHRIPVGHVEAGLRSGQPDAPFPEELHRRMVDTLASAWFAPTEHARQALLREGHPPARIFVTGNPVVDALYAMRSALATSRPSGPAPERPLALVTAHRRENQGSALQRICQAVGQLARDGASVIWPVHPNPAVEETVREALSGHPRVRLVEALPYPLFVRLLLKADLVLTDSGGVQEEAACLGRPVLILREVTERPEVFETGVVRLVGTEPDAILSAAQDWLARPPQPTAARPLGDGRAGENIAERVVEWLG